ncbi:hypothetical protein GJU39_06500 [Pedobacter petrophilus]|uniref:Uncharacterized protein n=1 Tax=Pedobacter petrophilus TaxID=1908241 RepID=A0A7K0FXF3_9SPHI|nr:hypothetical protein [Pedobacter petrophilus]MRX75734.1 hypothetical protein [Pedobacter petrophilus]
MKVSFRFACSGKKYDKAHRKGKVHTICNEKGERATLQFVKIGHVNLDTGLQEQSL